GSIDAVAEHVVRLHQLVNFTRSLVDHRAFAIAVEPADGELVGITVGAMDLNSITGRAFGSNRREPYLPRPSRFSSGTSTSCIVKYPVLPARMPISPSSDRSRIP